jgi:hypothetical protein
MYTQMEDNTKTDSATELEGMDWIQLAYDTVQGRLPVNATMKFHNIQGIS